MSSSSGPLGQSGRWDRSGGNRLLQSPRSTFQLSSRLKVRQQKERPGQRTWLLLFATRTDATAEAPGQAVPFQSWLSARDFGRRLVRSTAATAFHADAAPLS